LTQTILMTLLFQMQKHLAFMYIQYYQYLSSTSASEIVDKPQEQHKEKYNQEYNLSHICPYDMIIQNQLSLEQYSSSPKCL